LSRFASRVNASDSLFNTPQNQEVVQAELNLFAVQMLAQPPDFAIYIYSSDAFTFPLKNKLYEILFVRRV